MLRFNKRPQKIFLGSALGWLLAIFIIPLAVWGFIKSGVFLPNLNSGLVGYWTMNGSDINWSTGVLTDKSGNGNNGQFVGVSTTTSPIAGQAGSALKFNGSARYVNAGNASALNSVSSFTMSFWGKRNVSGGIVIISKITDADNRINIGPWSDGLVYFNVSNGGAAWGTVSSNDTKWHLYTMVFDGSQSGNSNRLKGYIDGALQSLTFAGASIAATTANISGNLEIGHLNLAPGYNSNGIIDDVRLWNRSLTAAEVLQLYNSYNMTG